jgi:hypothetical protein
MSWLKDRIDLLTSIDEEVTELEAECVVLVAELAIRREELRMATEDRMQAQLELKDKKNDRRVVSVPHTTLTTTLTTRCRCTTTSRQVHTKVVGYLLGTASVSHRIHLLFSFFFFLFFSQALAVFDKQLSTLEEQVALGDVRTYVGRVESALLYLWNEEPTGRAIPVAVQRALPDLGDRFVLAHCLDCAFLLEEENRGRSRPPMDPNGFYRCITEVVLQGATLKAALVLPSE